MTDLNAIAVCPKCGAKTWKKIERASIGKPDFHYYDCGSNTDGLAEDNPSPDCRIRELNLYLVEKDLKIAESAKEIERLKEELSTTKRRLTAQRFLVRI